MSTENPEQAALLAALKDTQQAIGQLQKPLECLALTQLVALAHSDLNVPQLIQMYRNNCEGVIKTIAELEAMDKKQAELTTSFKADVDKEKNVLSRQTKQDALENLTTQKANFERKHPLIAKLVKSTYEF